MTKPRKKLRFDVKDQTGWVLSSHETREQAKAACANFRKYPYCTYDTYRVVERAPKR